MSHGRNGTFLSSVAALSVLTLTSRHRSYTSLSTIIFHHSRPAARLVPAPSHHQLKCRDHGTKVIVQNLFGSMPVRIKQRALELNTRSGGEKEWELIRRNITGILLAWHVPISLSISGLGKEQRLFFRAPMQGKRRLSADCNLTEYKSFDLSLLRNILIQGMQLDRTDWDMWVKTSAETPFITIRALFSLRPYPTKHIQFISLGVQHINHKDGYNLFYDEVNRLFATSRYGAQEGLNVMDDVESSKRAKDGRFKCDGFTKNQLKCVRKGINRWPMFYIQIILTQESVPHTLKEYAPLGEEATVTSIISVLRTMIHTFLCEHHMKPQTKRQQEEPNSLGRDGTGYRQKVLPGKSTISDVSKSSKENNFQGLGCASSFAASPPAILASKGELRARPPALEFSGKIQVPSFAQSSKLQKRESFSTWSRIKSGACEPISSLGDFKPLTGRSSSEIFLSDRYSSLGALQGEPDLQSRRESASERSHSTEPGHELMTIKEHVSELRGNTNESTQNINTHMIPMTDPKNSRPGCDSCTQDDDTLSWTNPITNDSFLINSRTGMMIRRPLVSPPTWPSSSYSSFITEELHQFSQIPKSEVSERLKLKHHNSGIFSKPEADSWLDRFLQSWENPVFHQTEEGIPQISLKNLCLETGDTISSRTARNIHTSIHKVLTESTLEVSTKLERTSLENATVLAQVDKKFILVKMSTDLTNPSSEDGEQTDSHILVLVDQHAADERIRSEALLVELCMKPSRDTVGVRSKLGFTSAINTFKLKTPIVLTVDTREQTLFQRYAAMFAQWGILFDLSQRRLDAGSQDCCQVIVHALPPGIAERCRVDVPQLSELMRGEVWKREENMDSRPTTIKDSQYSTSQVCRVGESTKVPSTESAWLNRVHDCPQGILDMLNSRSCRSAIMFNDVLTLAQCETLIRRLSTCRFPFQCAHGRPSMIPLIGFDSSNTILHGLASFATNRSLDANHKENTTDFREAWRAWKIP